MTKITKKLTSELSLAKLQQIYDILQDRKDNVVEPVAEPVVEPVVEPAVSWIDFAKNYASENNINYKDAIVEIKEKGLYKPKEKVVKPKKILKKDVGYCCDICDYTTPDKSNFNRHMTKHNNKEKMMNELMTTRGLIRTHRVRASESKNSDVRVKSQAILDAALTKEKVLIPQLKKLREKDVTYTIEKTPKSKHKFPIDLIEKTNDAYHEVNGSILTLTKDNVENVEKHGKDYTLKVKDLIVDEDEEIDEIIFEYDDKFYGYNVSFMQVVDIKGKMVDVEYETFFVYV
jgi:hypothetical protein